MISEIDKAQESAKRWQQAAWGVLLGGLLLTLLVVWDAADTLQQEEDARFEAEARDATRQLEQLIDHHLDVLISFQAMFRVNGEVSRATFHAHHKALRTDTEYPALQAVQFAPFVTEAERPAFEARVRNDRSLEPAGHPDFRVHPPGPRLAYVPVLYNEPMARNQSVFGYDMMFEATRREALQRARDSGRLQASAPIRLIQGGARPEAVLVRLPVYRPGQPLDSVAQRRQAFLGLVSGVVRMSDLVAQTNVARQWQRLNLRIEDRQAPQLPLFDSALAQPQAFRPGPSPQARDRVLHEVLVGQRAWTLAYTRAAVRPWLHPYPVALLMGGLFASAGLFAMVRNQARQHARAWDMAQQLSRKARDSEHRLRAVVDHAIDGILSVAPSGRILSVNQAMGRIFGHAEAALVGQHLSLILPSAGSQEAGKRVEAFLQVQPIGMESLGHHTEGRRADGSLFPLDLAVSPMVLDGQKQFVGIVRDLTAQQAAERAVLEAHRQLNEVDEMRRVIVHNAPYAIFVINMQGVIQTVNPAGERMLGLKASELLGRCCVQHFFEAEQMAERARLLSLRLGHEVSPLEVLTHLAAFTPGLPCEWTVRRDDGSPAVVELVVTDLSNEFGSVSGHLVMAYDVTSRREAENQVQHLARHDALTALPNRHMLQEQLRHGLAVAEREGHPLALMFLDLDRFKKINDGLGHHVGDSVLVEVARRLRQVTRSSDTVARLGGDEFVVLLPEISETADSERVAQKILAAFAEPIRIGPHELRVTPSIGMALYPEHGHDAITLMRQADLAMYQAKHQGRNRVQVFNAAVATPSAETLVLENDLYHALERKELRLHFQPQFDCASGRITGAEALLRWQHQGRLVSPADFIPLAEETGLIVPMGHWVLREACHAARRWQALAGRPLRVGVNLSALQLEQADLADQVAQALSDSGLPATALELEITESVVVRESLRAADVLGRLRTLGVAIAIDDFGVGYSSFAYLRELPVDRFKLDRSFLQAVPQSQGDSRLLAALIAMGHRLEVGIVAEGVETAEQASFLRQHGCDEAQGYHLARPMCAEDFEALLGAASALSNLLPPQRLVTA